MVLAHVAGELSLQLSYSRLFYGAAIRLSIPTGESFTMAFIRFILVCAALIAMYKAIDGIWVNFSTHGNVQTFTINQIVASPGMKLPRYIEVTNAVEFASVCTQSGKTSDGRDACSEMKIPLFTEAQEESLQSGNPVAASVIVQADQGLVNKCNAQADCLDGATFKGVTDNSLLNDLDDEDKKVLSQNKVIVDGHTNYLVMEDQPDSNGLNVFMFFFGAATGLAAIFVRGKKKVVVEV
jgi:hypothetical protein